MQKNDNIPVLTDLIEKGIEIKLSELGLDTSQDLILDANEREELGLDVSRDLKLDTDRSEEPGLDASRDLLLDADDRDEPEFDASQLTLDTAPISSDSSDNPALEQMIRQILDQHMELAVQEIKQAISQAGNTEGE